MIIGQPGVGLLVALMLARGAATEAPDRTPPNSAVMQPELVASAAPAAGGESAGPAAVSAEGAFKRLPAGEQKTARAMLEAERVGPASDPAWSLDKIAAAKAAGKDWNEILAEMQAQHLVAGGDSKIAAITRGASANGKEQLSGELATANGPGDPKAAQAPSANAAASGDAGQNFAQLSPGDQKIARALFEAQQMGAKSAAPWSLEKIAGARTDSDGWTPVLWTMRRKGLITQKELGEIMRDHDQRTRGAIAPEVTLAAADQFAYPVADAESPAKMKYVSGPANSCALRDTKAGVKPVAQTE